MKDFVHASELDIVGALFGIIQKNDTVYLYLEDDESYYLKMTFNKYWLKDLQYVLSKAYK